MNCDLCQTLAAAFTVTAAYPSGDRPEAIHPTWSTYPAPMFRVCADHLPDALEADQTRAGATPGYLVRPIR